MPLDGSEYEKDMEELGKKLRGVTDETKRFAEEAQKEIKAFGSLSQETKTKADDALTKLGETQARLADIEQKLARRGGRDGGEVETKSLGEWVVDNDRVKAMHSGSRGSASLRIETKDITSAAATVGATAPVGNSLVPADRQPGILGLPQRRLVVRDLLAPGNTSLAAIEYPVETSFTNNAAPVAETLLKPKSDLALDLRNAPVRTIAHYMKASRQILDDAPQLRSLIDQRLRFGLELVEEAQLLYGAGTGANIKGIIPQASAYVNPMAGYTPGNAMDKIRLMLLQASLAEYPSTGIVMHPIDWARVELEKDGQGKYLVGDPQGVIVPRLWGLPVVATTAIALDTALVGAFRMGAQIFDRMAIEVLVSTENEDDFVKNLCTIRAEERLALAVYRPAAFVVGDLGFVA